MPASATQRTLRGTHTGVRAKESPSVTATQRTLRGTHTGVRARPQRTLRGTHTVPSHPEPTQDGEEAIRSSRKASKPELGQDGHMPASVTQRTLRGTHTGVRARPQRTLRGTHTGVRAKESLSRHPEPRQDGEVVLRSNRKATKPQRGQVVLNYGKFLCLAFLALCTILSVYYMLTCSAPPEISRRRLPVTGLLGKTVAGCFGGKTIPRLLDIPYEPWEETYQVAYAEAYRLHVENRIKNKHPWALEKERQWNEITEQIHREVLRRINRRKRMEGNSGRGPKAMKLFLKLLIAKRGIAKRRKRQSKIWFPVTNLAKPSFLAMVKRNVSSTALLCGKKIAKHVNDLWTRVSNGEVDVPVPSITCPSLRRRLPVMERLLKEIEAARAKQNC